MRKLTFALLIAICAIFCNITILGQEHVLEEADLLFQFGASSPMENAIAAATDRGEGPIVHVAIFAMVDGEPSVIQAVPEAGVSVMPLTKFIAECRKSEAVPCIKVMRAEGVQARRVIERALSYVGRSYDNAFLPGDDALYCSELVYECYLDADGTRIFETAPMNFLAPDGTLPEYWRELYRGLGIDVPQGQPGTNPAAMSRSPRLTAVFSF